MPNSEKTPGVIIRQMINTDAVSIHAIHTACLRNTLTSHYSSEQLEAWLEGHLKVIYEGQKTVRFI